MQINRHNYETFFLLYVDKELSAADRKAVDVFVQENPDLQMELLLLQQTVVSADDIVLQKKDWLYMEEDISALQESLLLFTDDELSVANKNAVESVLKTITTAKAEWELLQQTKLQPDMTVVFEDKELLYRKEDARIVGFKWWRVAVAAVLLGFGLWAGFSVYKNNFQKASGDEELVKENTIKPGQEKIVTPVADPNEKITAVDNAVAENSTATTNQQTNAQSGKKFSTPVEKVNIADNPNSITSNQNITQQNSNPKRPDNNLPLPERNRAGKPYFENINNKSGNEKIAKAVSSENNNNVRVSGNDEAVVKINQKENKTTVEDFNNSKTDASLTAIQVVNTTTAGDGENNNSYLNVDDSKEKRTALGGFIRKAKRVLERTTNVKTGDGIKIAGFEIALK